MGEERQPKEGYYISTRTLQSLYKLCQ